MRSVRLLAGALASALTAACGSDPPPSPPAHVPDADAGALVFQEKCANCHTIGGGVRTGPDLHGVTKRRERAWILRMMKDPVGLTKTDPVARELLAKANNVPMPPPGLNDDQIADVLAFVEQESRNVTSPSPPPSPHPSPPP